MDIATGQLAGMVDQTLNTNYYRAMLGALQSEAARFGYIFSKDGGSNDSPGLPKVLQESLALAVGVARESYLAPLKEKEKIERLVKREFTTGYPQKMLEDVLGCLRNNGIALQPGDSSKELLHVEEMRLNGQLIHHASKLLSAIHYHVGMVTPTPEQPAKLKLDAIKEFLELSGFDDSIQMVEWLSAYSHTEFSGPSPDVVSLLEPMIKLSAFEMDAIISTAKQSIVSEARKADAAAELVTAVDELSKGAL